MRRREFCRTVLAGAGALAVPRAAAPSFAAADSLGRIGIQLYSVRELFAVDPVGTLKQLAGMGYQEVELGKWDTRTVTDMRNALDKSNMKAPSAHVPIEMLRENLSLVSGNAKILGVKYVVCPSLPDELQTIGGYKQVAPILSQAGNVLRRSGITLAYHNHEYEFKDQDGQKGYDILLDESDKDVVKMELDIFWARKGGVDPLDYFKRYPGRFPLIHVKDMAADGSMVDVGAGVIDWKSIFRHADQAGIKHYFVEHDDPPSPMGFARASYDYLRGLRW
jgi:sugar phosphate isomerase/epimerase